MRATLVGIATAFCLLLLGSTVRAESYSSPDFTSADPVVSLHGGFSASTNFQLFGSSGPIVIGESTSTTFISRAGFLYFPFVSAPTLAAVSGASQVALSWSAADVALGYTVSAYEVGISQSVGGPYSFTNVGGSLSNTETGLNNGTAYYFVVRVRDFYNTVIATSSEVVSTPAGGANNQGGGGGGGGGIVQTNTANIYIDGTTFPGALVYVLKNGVAVGSVTSDENGHFIYHASFEPGAAVFALYAMDKEGNRSGTASYTTTLIANATVSLVNLLLPPLVTTDKESLIPGEILTVIAKGAPNANALINVEEIPALFLHVIFDSSGVATLPLDSTELKKGEYTLKGRLEKGQTVSSPSQLVKFLVGDKTKKRQPVTECRIADFNCDGHVDLVDFSILLYWFDKSGMPANIDLNADGRITIEDFSILIYYWTG